jgi:hypothetical protein
MRAALKFLERYHRDGDKFLDHIVTGDETWVSHFTPESKRQSLEWHHHRSPSKPRKFKQTLSTRKIMATVSGTGNASFWLSSCRVKWKYYRWMVNWKGRGRKQSWPNVRYSSGIWGETTKTPSQGSRSPGWVLNLGPPVYEAGALITQPRRSDICTVPRDV